MFAVKFIVRFINWLSTNAIMYFNVKNHEIEVKLINDSLNGQFAALNGSSKVPPRTNVHIHR